MKIKIKFKNHGYLEEQKIEKISVGDWIDLKAAETVTLKKGDYTLIPLGVAMQLPLGYEAHVLPRSSTYKSFRLLMVNGMGIIDNCYCGDEDEWMFPCIAMEDTTIVRGDRIAQFRIMRNQPSFEFFEVETLGNPSRYGIGSTGVR